MVIVIGKGCRPGCDSGMQGANVGSNPIFHPMKISISIRKCDCYLPFKKISENTSSQVIELIWNGRKFLCSKCKGLKH